MLRRSFIPTLLALGIVAPRAVLAQRESETRIDATKIAQAIERQWVANYDSGDAAQIGRMFAVDGRFITATGDLLAGPSEIETALAARIKAGWTKETVDVLEAHASGGMMWVMGRYALSGSGPYEGKGVLGRFVKVLSQEGADWRIRMLIGTAMPLGLTTPASPR